MNLLEKNEEWRAGFREVLQLTLQETYALDAFCQLGLPNKLSFFGEFFERFGTAILPREPVDDSLLSLLHWIFPYQEDADWIESIDSTSVERLFGLLGHFELPRFERERQEALLILSSFIRSIGLSGEVRRLTSNFEEGGLRESAFYQLQTQVERRLTPEEVGRDSEELHERLQQVRDVVREIYLKMESCGVSIDLVYQMERVSKYLDRLESLLHFSHEKGRRPQDVFLFLALVVRDNVNSKSLRGFVRQNVSLLSKRIVRTNSEIGDQYISRNKAQLKKLLGTATGGGLVTVVTVYAKIFFSSLTVAPFIVGFLNSVNYAFSFVAIQLAGFTLATKQPANTAPALAHKIENLESEKCREELVTEVVCLIRSQVTSIFGNVMGVVPGILLVGYSFYFFFDQNLISRETAEYILKSHSLFGPTLFFAAFTGVLLFASSLIAGVIENWFMYRRLKTSLKKSERLISIFGKIRTRKFAEFLAQKMAGLASNVSLGFLLGLTPEILGFFGLPIEVRHVTLAFGTLAAAVPQLAIEEIFSLQLLQIVIALVGVGFLNVAVSFSLALLVALRAQEVKSTQLRPVLRAILTRLRRNPGSFFRATR